jgi:hypothetical protein
MLSIGLFIMKEIFKPTYMMMCCCLAMCRLRGGGGLPM